MIISLLIVVISVLARIILKFKTKIYETDSKIRSKVVIVTGANTGIGYATAEDLARREAKVILACRDPQKGTAARNKIIHATGNKNVFFKRLDLSSFQSVQEFAEDILKTEDRLDILVNNAGTGGLDNSLTRDNLPIEAQVNHFSPVLLTLLLMPLLKASAPSRIVNVASFMHNLGSIDWLDRPAKNFWQSNFSYSNTKLANILFTKKLGEVLKDAGVTVNCLDPGPVSTDIFRHQLYIVKFLLTSIFLTAYQGAQTSIYLAVAPEVKSVTGKYFCNCSESRPAKKAWDPVAAEKVWKMSEAIVLKHKKISYK